MTPKKGITWVTWTCEQCGEDKMRITYQLKQVNVWRFLCVECGHVMNVAN